MLKRLLLIAAAAGILAGCTKDPPPKAENTRPVDTGLLDPFVAGQKPAGARSVAEVRKVGKDGDEVVVTGKIPPDIGKPFSNTSAQFTLADTKQVDDCDEPD